MSSFQRCNIRDGGSFQFSFFHCVKTTHLLLTFLEPKVDFALKVWDILYVRNLTNYVIHVICLVQFTVSLSLTVGLFTQFEQGLL